MHKIKKLGDCVTLPESDPLDKRTRCCTFHSLSHSQPIIPQPAIITSLNEPLPVFLPRYALLDSLYFPLFMNLTELLHFMHLQLAVLSVWPCFFLALPVHSHTLQHEARTPGFRSTAGPKTHAHKHTLEAPHTALADSGKEGGRSTWSHNLLPPVRNVAGTHQTITYKPITSRYSWCLHLPHWSSCLCCISVSTWSQIFLLKLP